MFVVRARFKDKIAEVFYDPLNGGFDLLEAQVVSLFDGFELKSARLLDFAGRLILTNDDVEDVKVVEITPEESILELNPGESGWEHIDVDQKNSEERLAGVVRAAAVVDVWVLDSTFSHVGQFCSRVIFPEEAVLQPSYRIIDTPFRLCARCQELLDPSLVAKDSSSLEAFICDSHKILEMGFLSHEGQISLESNALIFGPNELDSFPMKSYYRRILFQHAVSSQPAASLNPDIAAAEQHVMQRVQSQCQSVLQYEDLSLQAEARSVINYEKVRERATEYLGSNPHVGKDAAFLFGLLAWFKHDFFSWVNKPGCSNSDCGARPPDMTSVAPLPPTPEESEGGARNIEVYRCGKCGQITRFPRYNNPRTLLKSRRGRCGEWANCFVLICRSLGLDARYVLDFTDHVWAEVWVSSLRRYVHCDPCEKKMDSPLMYEAGWNKKLSFIFSISRHGVIDATPRYSRKLIEVMQRRAPVSERFIADSMKSMDQWLESWYVNHIASRRLPSGRSSSSLNLDMLALSTTEFENLAASDISVTTMRRRKRLLLKEIAAVTLVTGHEWKSEELQGRISGDRAWKEARGEDGRNAGAAASGTNTATAVGTAASADTAVAVATVSSINVMAEQPWMLQGLVTTTSALKSSHGHTDIFTCSVGGLDRQDAMGAIASLHAFGAHSHNSGNGHAHCVSIGGAVLASNNSGHNVVVVSAYTGGLLQSVALNTGVAHPIQLQDGVPSKTPLVELEALLQDYLDHSESQPVFAGPGLGSSVDPGVGLDVDDRLDRMPLHATCSTTSTGTGTHDALTTELNNVSQDVAAVVTADTSSVEPVDAYAIATTTARTESAIVVVSVTESGHHCGHGIRHLMKSLGDDQVTTGGPEPQQSWLVVSSPGGLTSPTFHSLRTGWGPAMVRVRCLLAREDGFDALSSDDKKTGVCGNQGAVTVTLKEVDGFTCSVPSVLLTTNTEATDAREQFDKMLQHASELCSSSSSYLGLVSIPAAGVVLLFGDSGYPLQQCTGAKTILKTVKRVRASRGALVPAPPSSATSDLLVSSAQTSGVVESKESMPEVPVDAASGNDMATRDGGCSECAGPVSEAGADTGMATAHSFASSSSLKSLSSVEQALAVKYIPVGGNHHGDTVGFDSTLFLWSLLDELYWTILGRGRGMETLWDQLNVDQINVWAGSDLVNGLQCKYSIPSLLKSSSEATLDPHQAERCTFPSPIFTSHHDAPTQHSFIIPTHDEVRSVQICSGNVVDSVTVRTAGGLTWRAGGGGGSPSEEVVVPQGWRFIGFYGGTGGHMHHLGIVVLRSHTSGSMAMMPPSPSRISDSQSRTLHAIWALTFQHGLWVAPLLNLCQHLEEHQRHADVGKLLVLLSVRLLARVLPLTETHHITHIGLAVAVIRDNSSSTSVHYFQSTSTYIDNLIKEPNGVKQRKIRLGNAFFEKNICAVAGGLELFCFGPAGFRLSSDCTHLSCCVSPGRSAHSSLTLGAWQAVLRSYSSFLRDVAKLLT